MRRAAEPQGSSRRRVRASVAREYRTLGNQDNHPLHPVDSGDLLVTCRKNRDTTAQIRPSKQRQRRLRPDDVEHPGSATSLGIKIVDLAKRITRQTVLEEVRRLGLPRHPILSPEETAKAARLYQARTHLPSCVSLTWIPAAEGVRRESEIPHAILSETTRGAIARNAAPNLSTMST
jgi:hypothetical protein